MKQYKVTNVTQGRLEIGEDKKVLDAGAWAIINDPLPDSVKRRIGGRYPTIRVEEIIPSVNGAPAPAAKPVTAPAATASPDRTAPRKGRADE